jgi:hypothetical protein
LDKSERKFVLKIFPLIPEVLACRSREYKRAETMASLESGKSWPLAVLDAPKEILEGMMEAKENGL